MASPRTITIVALSVALGLFFVFMGTIKLTPRLSRDAYNEMVSRAAGRRCSGLSRLAAGAVGDAGGDCPGTPSEGQEREEADLTPYLTDTERSQ